MKAITASVFLFLTVTMTSCQSNNNNKATYTIVAPTVVRPNTDFLVAVSVFNIGIQDRKKTFTVVPEHPSYQCHAMGPMVKVNPISVLFFL